MELYSVFLFYNANARLKRKYESQKAKWKKILQEKGNIQPSFFISIHLICLYGKIFWSHGLRPHFFLQIIFSRKKTLLEKR